MKTGFQRWIGVVVAYSLFLCSISITCIASDSATNATTAENRHPIADKKRADALLKKSFDNDDEAIDAYRKAIELDPGRAIAHLKLGDTLRNQLSKVDSFEEKIELTKEIKVAYLQYQKLSEKSTSAIDSFLALNIVDTPIINFCEYVAAYTNQGRLRELFGSGRSITKTDGKGTIRIDRSLPWIRFFDNETNEEIQEDFGRDTEGLPYWEETNVAPFLDGQHLVHHIRDDYLVMSEPIGLSANTGKCCRFSAEVTESFEKKGRDTEICRLLDSSREPSFITFHKSHHLDKYAMKTAGLYPEWVNEIGAGEVDFDNDGKTKTLVHIQFACTGGPGCDYEFFDLLNEEKNGFSSSKRRSLLLKMQGIEHNARGFEHVPVPHCHGNVTGWFRYKGITYFLTKYRKHQPESSDEEFHTVSYIKNGKIHKVCAAEFKKQVEVQK